jgi:hypothetical protein
VQFVWLNIFDEFLGFIHENWKLILVGQMENSLLATIFGVAKSFDTIQDTTHQNVIVDSRYKTQQSMRLLSFCTSERRDHGDTLFK